MANLRILIQISQELARTLVSSDLRELERNRTTAISSTRGLFDSIPNGIAHRAMRLTGWLTIGNCDHQDRLVQTVGPGWTHDHRLNHLVSQVGAERGQSCEANPADELVDILGVADAITALGRVHETHGDTILVESRRSCCDKAEDLS